MSENPAPCTVSVIIPCYNSGKYLAKAIQSVLDQKIEGGCEILVINDGSTDETPEVLASFAGHTELRVLTHPGGVNKDVCESRRLGIREARGEFVSFLDADDAYLPGKLARHTGVLRENPRVVLVHSRIQFVTKDPGVDYGWDFSMGDKAMTYDMTRHMHFLRRNMISNSTVVCRRSTIFPDDLPHDMVLPAEDWVIWNSMGQRGLFYYDPEPLTAVLVHAQSYTSRLARTPGSRELRAIEFYLTVISRLGSTRARLRALGALAYNMFKLVQLRAGPNWRPGLVGRTLNWFFKRAK